MRKDFSTVAAHVIARVRQLRMESGMSVRVLAERVTACGYYISRDSLAHHEDGKAKDLSVGYVVAVALALNVPVTALLPDAVCGLCGGAPPAGFACLGCGHRTPHKP